MAPKMDPKIEDGTPLRLTFSRPFRDLVIYVDFMLNLVTIQHPFGTLCLFLAPFWRPLAPIWFTFDALGLTFDHPGAQFSHF